MEQFSPMGKQALEKLTRWSETQIRLSRGELFQTVLRTFLDTLQRPKKMKSELEKNQN